MSDSIETKEKKPVYLATKVGDKIDGINEIGIEYIKDYCNQNKKNAEVKAFIKEVILAEPKPDKNGTLRKPTTATIRAAFVDRFMPEVRKSNKPSKTVYDWAADFLSE